MPVQVLEQAANFSEAGAGIQLGPNGVHVLRALGVADSLASCAVAPEGVHLFDAHAGLGLTTVPLGPMAEMRYGAPYWVVHRADLQRVLLEAVRANDNVMITQAVPVAHAREGQRVQVTSEAGETAEGDALIGADGLRSRVRTAIGAGGQPVYSGKSAWRLTVPFDTAPCANAQHADRPVAVAARAYGALSRCAAAHEVNIVAIVDDQTAPEGWNVPGSGKRVPRPSRGWPQR